MNKPIHLLQKKLTFLLLLFVILFSFDISANNMNDELPSEYILILNPDAETCAWSESLIPLIIEELKTEHPELPVYVDYMFSLSIRSEKEAGRVKRDLFTKYKNPPKYLLLIESEVYALFRDDIDMYWGEDIPTILLAREDYIGPPSYYIKKEIIPQEERSSLRGIAASRKNLTVVSNPFDLTGTIGLMKQMFPEMKKIFFVTDNRYISAILRDNLQKIVTVSYPELEVENITPGTHTTDELISGLTAIPEDNCILYFTWSNKDLKEKEDVILEANIYRIISLYTQAPIFTVNDIGLEESEMLGGCFTPYKQVVKTYASAVDHIIDGSTGSRFIYCPTPTPTFNYEVMMEYGIPESILPKKSYLYNKPLGFLEKNKDLLVVWIISLFLGIFAIRILFLSHTHKMQQKEIRLLERYSDLINNMPIGYAQGQIVTDQSGAPVDYIVSEANSSYEKNNIYGWNFIGKKAGSVSPEIVTEIINLYKSLLKEKKKKTTALYHDKSTNQHYSIILSLPCCKSQFIDIFYVDTTELYQTQRKLQITNKKLNMSLEVAGLISWKWNLNSGNIVYDMPYGEQESYDKENQFSISAEDYFKQIHPEDKERIQNAYARLRKGEITKFKEEFRHCHPVIKNKYEWVEAQAIVETKNKEGESLTLLGSTQLTTERKKIEQELVNARDKAEESNRLKSAFLANISHEIRTPLNAIVGFSNLLVSNNECDEEQMVYVELIEENTKLLLQLVSNIMDLSKIEASSIDRHYSNIDLNSFLEEFITPTKEKTNGGVQVIYEQPESPYPVRLEKKWLKEVLRNLLENAAKFTSNGSIRYGYSVVDDKMLYFYVKDSGKGISPALKEKIFDRFVKIDYFIQGGGLGLPISQAIVRQFGGEIGVESEEGKGSTFWFTFPYYQLDKVPMKI